MKITERMKQIINRASSKRFIELDIVRGFAIVFMVFLHLLWDLDYFGILPLNENIYQFNIICPALFFLILGMCLAVANEKNKINNRLGLSKHLFSRGLKIFSLGLLISAFTFFFIPEKPILFGVLHCIGLSIILSIPFLKLKTYNIIPAIVIILIGLVIGMRSFTSPSLLHFAFGFHQADVWKYTVDYFPIFPWLGVSLLGVSIGSVLYKNNLVKI